MSINRMEMAEAFAREQIKRNPNIIGVIVTGSTARNDWVETSDIDIRLLISESASSDIERKNVQICREDVFLDVEYESADTYSAPTKLLKNPYLAGCVREAVILFDKDEMFAGVQRIVAEQFMKPKWLKERLASLIPSIERNCKEFTTAVREHNEVEMCRASIFALWTICDALLVSRGISPSWVRGLQKLEEILPLEREQIINIEGSTAMTLDEVSGFLPLFEQSEGIGTGPMFQHVQREIEWMIQNNLHCEAFHALWIGFGLALRRLMGSDEAEKQRRAQSLARSWLTKINWDGDELKFKERQLDEYVSHILQLVDAVA